MDGNGREQRETDASGSVDEMKDKYSEALRLGMEAMALCQADEDGHDDELRVDEVCIFMLGWRHQFKRVMCAAGLLQ